VIVLFVPLALAAEPGPCDAFYTPTDVVETALRVDGARRAGADPEPERRELLVRLACVAEPLSPGDAAAVHLALEGEVASPVPAPHPEDAERGPPHPEGGVSLVDGVAHAALRPDTSAVVQAFDSEGRVVYTEWVGAPTANLLIADRFDMPDAPTLPKLPPVPLRRGEIARLVASGALVVASGALFGVAADARHDWYALEPSPVKTVGELERLRVRTNVAQGAGLACAGLGAAGLLTVAVRVPF
jgi:hypothetical protein